MVRPGTYFNPQTEVVVIVDDSASIDQEVFNMEAYEGADWVRISDDVPVDQNGLETALEQFQTHYHAGSRGSMSATALEQGDDEYDEDEDGQEPGPRGLTGERERLHGRRARAGHRLDGPTTRASARCAGTPTPPRPEQVSFSWRRMPPGTGGRGSYGHRHPGQEEVYFVISGPVTFKVGDDVFEAESADRGAG